LTISIVTTLPGTPQKHMIKLYIYYHYDYIILYIIKYPPCPRRVSYKPGTPARVSSSWRHPTAQLLPTTTF